MKPSQPFTTPVLLIAFNRPDCLREVLDVISVLQPRSLYLALDGPRQGHPEDVEAQNVIKEMAGCVDWPCDFHTLYREQNLGCGYGPAGAISWVLEHEDRVIVLEDDCVPNLSFFAFCEEMLERYKDDERVGLISGRSHHSNTSFFSHQDYLFTYYPHTWGWATWKRFWADFDMKMKDYPRFAQQGGTASYISIPVLSQLMDRQFKRVYSCIEQEVTHSWDTQALFLLTRKHQLGIVPSKNLIENIGIYGSHSFGYNNRVLPREDLPDVIRHPRTVSVDESYEKYHYDKHLKQIHPSFLRRLIQYLRRHVNL